MITSIGSGIIAYIVKAGTSIIASSILPAAETKGQPALGPEPELV